VNDREGKGILSANVKKHPKKRKRILLVLLVMVVLLVGGSVGFVEYTSTPAFCNSCHFMKPYVESWKTSSHNMVSCTKCHFPPGWRNWVRGKLNGTAELFKTIARTHGPKPDAEVEDAACLRGGCHETRLLEGKVLFKGKYNFDHVPHLTKLRRGKQLRCTSCHSQIVQGAHIAVTTSVCFTCHFKERISARELHPIGKCTSCHEMPKEGIKLADGSTFQHQDFTDRGVDCWKCHLDSVQGTGDVPKQVCVECHDAPEKMEKYSDSTFMHNWHVTQRKVECFRCHNEIRHGLLPEPYEEHTSCAGCHSPGHFAPRDMLEGRGGKGIEGTPSKHFLANVDCVACHEFSAETHDGHPVSVSSYEAGEKACIACHGTAMEGMLETWWSGVSETLAEAKAALAKTREEYKTLDPGDPQESQASALLEEAQHNCEFVEKGRGVHNPEYALELLDRAMNDTTEAARILNRSRTSEAPPNEEAQ